MRSTALVLVKLSRGQACVLIQENWRMMRGLEVESDSESELVIAESLEAGL